MIDFAAIRAAARAVDGDVVGMTKAQLDQLLDAAEAGQRSGRAAVRDSGQDAGIERVSRAA